ncbi:unnamed protein product [Parascedosporium putredinis]|uniref:Ethyl tert-butyl ether degradation EthD n=1 Tax=Parascedosporium putredinis TaxID=1442378 RepID=A0A9P1H2P3_9PEZI|nr:unnamed protein product [Parascedosporium putredinis]CAI7993922.1 unnamed protein product [Parascedosporium putredinis]
MATVTILYESGPKFDVQYYITKHFALVEEKWGPLGLLSWEVVEFEEGSPYQIQATTKWKSIEAFEAAAGNQEVMAAVIGDVPNYTTAKPTFLKGKTVGSKL